MELLEVNSSWLSKYEKLEQVEMGLTLFKRRPILAREKFTQFVNTFKIIQRLFHSCLVGRLQCLPSALLLNSLYPHTHITFVPLLFQSSCEYQFQFVPILFQSYCEYQFQSVGNWVEHHSSFLVLPWMNFLVSIGLGSIDPWGMEEDVED